MRLSPRLFAFAAVGVAPVLMLQGCGGDETGARTTLGTVQNTSYVVEPPITTTTKRSPSLRRYASTLLSLSEQSIH